MTDRRRPTVSIGAGERTVAGDDRGVSDVVGYVLVFSLVTVTIGTVFGVGIVGIEDRQEDESVANVERAFEVFDDNMRDVQRYGDPSRSTEIRLAGGTLSVTETTAVTVRRSGDADPDVDDERVPNATWESRTLTYASGDTTVAYESGALFRRDGDAAVMLSPPRFVAADGRTTVPIVRLFAADADRQAGGTGTVQVTTTGLRSRTTRPVGAASDENLYLWVESEYADAWRRYFDRHDGFEDATDDSDDCAAADGCAVARIVHDETVYVQRYGLDVALRR
ncbi:hypothetical protein GJ633_06250 [Halorubrum sp. CBA1125]|uniref:DUF7289 family protein n=1 Tax=Halorubrum sp. CBA1125 TaxID=2668072 RepID=UPI00135EAB73|nr:hypothetical protein [Halorubrum sp. CBA1125]MUW14304.1 hypothetical protein [Halorubrum sp. CBA1125]